MSHQTGPAPIYAGPIFICVAVGIFLLGREIFQGNRVLADEWRERDDLQIIRRILGGGFMLGGGVFGIAGIAILVLSLAHATH